MPLDEERWELLAQVSALYYKNRLTQSEIARRLGVSRPTISRLLKEANQEAIVEIHINFPIRRVATLENKLAERFSLRHARVLATNPADQAQALSRLGILAARYLETTLKHGSTLAICWGRTAREIVNAIRPTFGARVNVVQMLGSLGPGNQQIDAAELARRLAAALGGEYWYVPAPLVVESPEMAQALLRERDVRHTLDLARKADVALVGIGSLDPRSSHLVQIGYLTAAQCEAIRAQGGVGDIIGRIFDAQGQPCAPEFNRCVIGITLEELRQIPLVIGVAGGQEKALAILGALRGRLIDVLCTDDVAAIEVLRLINNESEASNM